MYSYVDFPIFLRGTRTRFRTLIRQYPPGDPEKSLAPLDVGDRGSAAVALAGVGARPVEVAGAEHPPGEAVRPVNLEDRQFKIASCKPNGIYWTE